MARIKIFLLIFVLSLLSTMLLWLPFFLRLPEFWGVKLPKAGMATIVANFDGPYYIVAAKSLYDPGYIEENFSFPLHPIYYSAHYPLFPLLIRALSVVFGYPYSMIIVTLITSILAAWFFYLLAYDLGFKKSAPWLTVIFLFLPARWFIVRSIGSPEPLFIFTIIASVYFFRKQKWWLAGIFGALAQATKPPGILLFIAYLASIMVENWPKLAHANFSNWFRQLPWKAYPILLIPITLLSIYAWYGIKYGNFLAYFNSGDNIHLMFPPFLVFNPSQTWVGTFWLEEIIWIYLFGLLGAYYLIRQKRVALGSFVSIFFLSILFVSHRDVARYSLPIVPFLLIAFSKVLIPDYFKWIFAFLLIPIYVFSVAFIANNITPITDWGPLL